MPVPGDGTQIALLNQMMTTFKGDFASLRAELREFMDQQRVELSHIRDEHESLATNVATYHAQQNAKKITERIERIEEVIPGLTATNRILAFIGGALGLSVMGLLWEIFRNTAQIVVK